MNEQTDRAMLEERLSELTTWSGPAEGLCEKALTDESEQRAGGWSSRWRISTWSTGRILAACAALAVTVGVVTTLWPERSLRGTAMVVMEENYRPSTGIAHRQNVPGEPSDRLGETQFRVNGVPSDGHSGSGGALRPSAPAWSETSGPIPPITDSVMTDSDRRIARRASLELLTNDVRAAFLRAQLVLSEAAGEFVQDSSLTDDERGGQASLTLRVRAERLGDVLRELGELGTVKNLKSGADDVTTQMIDLDARIRNEQRMEKELLELLDTRPDAPLKEILEVRQQVATVRLNIERMTGEQKRLSRLVSLATVLLIIRPEPKTEDAAQQPTQQSFSQHFKTVMFDAWSEGTRSLIDTLAGVLSVLIGGLLWWVCLVVAVFGLRTILRRRAMRLA